MELVIFFLAGLLVGALLASLVFLWAAAAFSRRYRPLSPTEVQRRIEGRER